MILTPPLLDATAMPLPMRPLGVVERLLAFFDTAVIRLVAFAVLTPLLWSALGEPRFGLVATATALASLLNWPLGAFSATVTRMLLAALRVDDFVRLRRVLLMGWLLLAVLGLGMASLLAVGSGTLVDAVGLDAALGADAGDYVALTGLRLWAVAATSVWQSAVLAAGLGGELAAARGVRVLLEVLVAFAVAAGEIDLPTLGWLELLIVGGWGAALLVALRQAGAGWLPSPDDFHLPTARALYAHGALEATQSTAFLLTFDVAIFVTALVQGPETAALLAVVAAACRLSAASALQLATLIFGRLRELAVSTPRVQRRWLVRRTTDAAIAAVGGVAVLWAVMSQRVLASWLETLVPNGMGWWVAVLLPVAVSSVVAVRYLATVGLDNQLGPVAAAELVLATVLALGLIGPWGPAGGVAAVTVAHLASTGWRAPLTMCRDLRLGPLRFARGRLLRLAMGTLAAWGAGTALMGLRAVRTAREVGIVAVICLILHAVAAWTSWYLAAQRVGVEND